MPVCTYEGIVAHVFLMGTTYRCSNSSKRYSKVEGQFRALISAILWGFVILMRLGCTLFAPPMTLGEYHTTDSTRAYYKGDQVVKYPLGYHIIPYLYANTAVLRVFSWFFFEVQTRAPGRIMQSHTYMLQMLLLRYTWYLVLLL